jgi:5-methyltetrahydropteroyltriglutamate--homocysteine methyltransferase
MNMNISSGKLLSCRQAGDLLPGVIAISNIVVEHPELVAQRIARYAKVVGRESVIASVDCGFGTVSYAM